jgi:hypothetical protein
MCKAVPSQTKAFPQKKNRRKKKKKRKTQREKQKKLFPLSFFF